MTLQVAVWAVLSVVAIWWRREIHTDKTGAEKRHRVGRVIGIASILGCLFYVQGFATRFPYQTHPNAMVRRVFFLGALVALASAIVADGLVEAVKAAGDPTTIADADLAGRARRFKKLWAHQRRSLTMLGIFLTFIVVTTGAKDLANNTAEGATVQIPTAYLLVQGLIFVGILLLIYLPPYFLLREQGEHLAERLAKQIEGDTHPAPAEQPSLDDRVRKFRSSLGVDEDINAWLERGVVILAPLISAVLTTFVA